MMWKCVNSGIYPGVISIMKAIREKGLTRISNLEVSRGVDAASFVDNVVKKLVLEEKVGGKGEDMVKMEAVI